MNKFTYCTVCNGHDCDSSSLLLLSWVVSMATVCGCCLAMLDAGVPLKTAVAGVAMGLILGAPSLCGS